MPGKCLLLMVGLEVMHLFGDILQDIGTVKSELPVLSTVILQLIDPLAQRRVLLLQVDARFY